MICVKIYNVFNDIKTIFLSNKKAETEHVVAYYVILCNYIVYILIKINSLYSQIFATKKPKAHVLIFYHSNI